MSADLISSFSCLSIEEQHRRLQIIRALIVLCVSGDNDMIERMISTLTPLSTLPDGTVMADAADKWLAS